MKVKFLKDHLSHSEKDVKQLEDTEAKYLIRCGVCEEVKGKPRPRNKRAAKPKAK